MSKASEKATRNCKEEIWYSSTEIQELRIAAKRLKMRPEEYIRRKSLANDNIPVIGNDKKIIEKCSIGIWYVNMVNTINLVEQPEIKKELNQRMGELECLLLK